MTKEQKDRLKAIRERQARYVFRGDLFYWSEREVRDANRADRQDVPWLLELVVELEEALDTAGRSVETYSTNAAAFKEQRGKLQRDIEEAGTEDYLTIKKQRDEALAKVERLDESVKGNLKVSADALGQAWNERDEYARALVWSHAALGESCAFCGRYQPYSREEERGHDAGCIVQKAKQHLEEEVREQREVRDLPTDDEVEGYIQSLTWHGEDSDWTKTVVAGNIHAGSYRRAPGYQGEPESPLAHEIKRFEAALENWLEYHPGKWAVIHKDDPVYFFAGQWEATGFGHDKFGNVSFLVRQILPEQPVRGFGHLPQNKSGAQYVTGEDADRSTCPKCEYFQRNYNEENE